MESSDPTIRSITAASDTKSDLTRIQAAAGIREGPWPKKPIKVINKIEERSWRGSQSQGQGQEAWSREPKTSKWVTESSFMSEWEYIAALTLRTTPTRRGRGGDVTCRRCNKDIETLGHISGSCQAVKRQRIVRHDMICKDIIEKAKAKGYRYLVEPKLPADDGTSWGVPDVVLVKGKSAWIIDPTVVWDGRFQFLQLAANKKVTKYSDIISRINVRQRPLNSSPSL